LDQQKTKIRNYFSTSSIDGQERENRTGEKTMTNENAPNVLGEIAEKQNMSIGELLKHMLSELG